MVGQIDFFDDLCPLFGVLGFAALQILSLDYFIAGHKMSCSTCPLAFILFVLAAIAFELLLFIVLCFKLIKLMIDPRSVFLILVFITVGVKLSKLHFPIPITLNLIKTASELILFLFLHVLSLLLWLILDALCSFATSFRPLEGWLSHAH